MRTSRGSSAAWAVVAASGLVLALAGSLMPPTDASRQGAGGVALTLPRAISAIALGGFGAAVGLLFALLIPRGVRRKKKGDEEFDLYHDPPAVSPWAQALIIVVLLLPLLVAGYLIWSGAAGRLGSEFVALPGVRSPAAEHSRVVPPTGVTRLSAFDVLLAVTTCVAAVVAAGVMLWLHFGDRLAWWWVRSPFDATCPLRIAVDESLDDLRDDADPRRAIISSYRRFERALAAAHVPRPPWQTALEFMREALTRVPVPSAAVERLTSLFEIARFSQRPVGARERDAAAYSLAEIKATLPTGDHDARNG